VTIVKITVIHLKNTFYIKFCNKTFLNPGFCKFGAKFDSFDVSDSCHVIVEHYLARQSRDNCQNNCHTSQKHVFYQMLQKNVSKPCFCNFRE